jgi:hypothetical protein
MNLETAYNLLVEDGVADNHRYFAEVFKFYNFKNEDLLKDYIDFILHEPVHWMRGFPAKLTTKPAFAKPKTAVIKLLKKPSVIAELGQEYADRAHDAIWKTFKKEHEAILNERSATHADGHNDAQVDVGDSESLSSFETLPPVPTATVAVIKPLGHPQQQRPVAENTDQERIAFLKTLLGKFAETMPNPAIADAFRLLVERV